MTWDEAALERVFDEATKEVARASTMPDFIFGVDEALGSDEAVVQLVQADGSFGPPIKARWVAVKDKPEDALMRLRRAADAYVHPGSKAEEKRLRLQKERRANQQHFRHHGAKR